MKRRTGVKLPTVPSLADSADGHTWILDGQAMATREPATVFETIDIKHAAEAASHEVIAKHLDAKGSTVHVHWTALTEKLKEMGFDVAEHLHQIAHGWMNLRVAIALLLVSAALTLFVLLAHAPLWLAILLAFLVLASAGAVEEFFQAYSDRDVVREAIFLALSLLVITAQFWLGTLRGRLLGALAPAAAGPASAALGAGARILRWTLGVFALAAEVMAGYKLWRARVALLSPAARAVRERGRCEQEIIAIHAALESAKAEPGIRRNYRRIGARQQLAWAAGAEERARADARAAEERARAAEEHARKNHLKRAVTGAIIALLILGAMIIFLGGRLSAAPLVQRNVVALVDFSRSVTAESFKANTEGVTAVLGQIRAGDRVLVVGITNSFGTVAVLFDRVMPATAGYMGLDQQAAREGIAAEWDKIVPHLRPIYKETDILGGLFTIGHLIAAAPQGTCLFIFSDLQQSTAELDLEHMKIIPVNDAILRIKKEQALPPLKGMQVFLLGVDPLGKSSAYFGTLKEFWLRLFQEAGADVKTFSLGRRVPEF